MVRSVLLAMAEQVGAAGATSPKLRLLSALAEGADRLVADVALAIGFTLETILPFQQLEYEKDFALPVSHGRSAEDCLAEFRRLLARSSAFVELDGGREAEAAGYQAASWMMLHNADVLVALWDGLEGKGRGGTADTVRYALSLGVPVWWIPLGSGEPHWLTETWHATERGTAPAGAHAEDALARHLATLLLLPKAGHDHPDGPFAKVARWVRAALPSTAPREEGPLHQWWDGAYAIFERRVSRGALILPDPAVTGHVDPPWCIWQKIRNRAETAAGSNMRAYRSAYVGVLTLAALALVAAVLSIAVPAAKPALTALELVFLLGIGWFVVLGHVGDWHERAVSHRLMAELVRKQSFLSLLGASLRVRPLRSGAENRVAWRFATLLRAAPLPRGAFTPARLEGIRQSIATGLLREQEIYHRNRAARFRMASATLTRWGDRAFLATLLLVAVKAILLLLHLAHETALVLGIAAAILPAFAAFSVGIRSYAEFDLLARQSEEMAAVMRAAHESLFRVPLDMPGASQEMARLVRAVTDEMLRDVKGWSTVSGAKMLEA